MPHIARRDFEDHGATPLTRENFCHIACVSRETHERLEAYIARLRVWQRRVNLVSADSMTDVWRRHVLDSTQLFQYLPRSSQRLVDLGSGAGFPGLVLAILGSRGVELVEQNSRKCAFLADAARHAGVTVTIHNARIETMPAAPADVVTARACAPLARLLDYAERFMTPSTLCLCLKGVRVDEELAEVSMNWKMRVGRIVSKSDARATLLRIQEVARVSPR